MCASPRRFMLQKNPSVSDPTTMFIKYHRDKMAKQDSSLNLFQKQDSDIFKNPFLVDDFGDNDMTPMSNRSNIMTRSGSRKNLFGDENPFSINKNPSI